MARWRQTKSEENGGGEREEGQNVVCCVFTMGVFFCFTVRRKLYEMLRE